MDGVPGSDFRPKPGPALAIVWIQGMNCLKECVLFSLSCSAFQKEFEQKLVKLEEEHQLVASSKRR